MLDKHVMFLDVPRGGLMGKRTQRNGHSEVARPYELASREPTRLRLVACPQCGEDVHLHRSRWRLQDLPFRILLSIPVRCGSCTKRFYIGRWSKAKAAT